ncbi:MAG: type IV secretion system DNA-binding domain-containing protein [Pirellulaceae bacterium]
MLAGFFKEERTAYQVFTTITSRLSYFRQVAALWQRTERRLSLREWLASDSILLLGANATVKTALNAVNEQLFRVIVEEIDVQTDSESRRTWVWIDEARLSGPLLKGEHLSLLALKGRSRGAVLVLSFQDIEGFRDACGSPRLANEIIAQCSHKALLRMESDESASWASKLLGSYETIEYFRSDNQSLLKGHHSLSEQRVTKEAVLASEFFLIEPANPRAGVTGFFLSPGVTPYRGTIKGCEVARVVVPTRIREQFQFQGKEECEQWLKAWSEGDRERLGLMVERENVTGQNRLRFRGDAGRLVVVETEHVA